MGKPSTSDIPVSSTNHNANASSRKRGARIDGGWRPEPEEVKERSCDGSGDNEKQRVTKDEYKYHRQPGDPALAAHASTLVIDHRAQQPSLKCRRVQGSVIED